MLKIIKFCTGIRSSIDDSNKLTDGNDCKASDDNNKLENLSKAKNVKKLAKLKKPGFTKAKIVGNSTRLGFLTVIARLAFT